jgi:DNA-directed RNA polymerase specialized sigma24 family protein
MSADGAKRINRMSSVKENIVTDISRHLQLQTEIEELIPTFRSFAKTFCKSQIDADELVREALSEALESLDQFTEDMQLKSWMFAIMHDIFRRQLVAEMLSKRSE